MLVPFRDTLVILGFDSRAGAWNLRNHHHRSRMLPVRAVTDSIGITWVCSTSGSGSFIDDDHFHDKEIVRCVAGEWAVHVAAPQAWHLTLSAEELRGRVEGAVRQCVERRIPLSIER